MNKSVLTIVLATCLTLFSVSSNASFIEYTYSNKGSGTLSGVEFKNKAFSIVQQADTDDIVSCGTDCFSIAALTTTITIKKLGTFIFRTKTRTFKNGRALGFSRATGSDLLYSIKAPVNYDLATEIAPFKRKFYFLQWTLDPVMTSGGALVFNSGSKKGKFQASFISQITSVPEPGAIALLGLSLIGLCLSRRKKFK